MTAVAEDTTTVLRCFDKGRDNAINQRPRLINHLYALLRDPVPERAPTQRTGRVQTARHRACGRPIEAARKY